MKFIESILFPYPELAHMTFREKKEALRPHQWRPFKSLKFLLCFAGFIILGNLFSMIAIYAYVSFKLPMPGHDGQVGLIAFGIYFFITGVISATIVVAPSMKAYAKSIKPHLQETLLKAHR